MNNQTIKRLIMEGDIENAIDNLLVFSEETRFHNDAIVLSGTYRLLKLDTLKGIVSDRREWNKISDSILLLADEIGKTKNKPVETTKEAKKEIQKQLILLGIDVGGRFTQEGQLIKKFSNIENINVSSELILDIDKVPNLIARSDLPTIIHLIDDDERGVYYVDAYGRNQPIGKDLIDTASMLLTPNIILLVLSGCFNLEQAKLFSKLLPVIGVKNHLSLGVTERFFAKFYEEINCNNSIEGSFGIALTHIKSELEDDLYLPKLLLNGIEFTLTISIDD